VSPAAWNWRTGMHHPAPPAGGWCLPPAIGPSALPGGKGFFGLGLDEGEIRDLAVWLRCYHPDLFEAGLLAVSDLRSAMRTSS
jgi:hypothetical protein